MLRRNAGKVRVLMVCTGNICRSPLAEVVVRAAVAKAGFSDWVEIDSAGTHARHVGEPPDIRARRVAARRGYDLSGCRARKIGVDDFARFDRILAMDRENLEALECICPPAHRSKLGLFARYACDIARDEIPDPYYGSIDGFERVLGICEAASRGLLDAFLGELGSKSFTLETCVADNP